MVRTDTEEKLVDVVAAALAVPIGVWRARALTTTTDAENKMWRGVQYVCPARESEV